MSKQPQAPGRPSPICLVVGGGLAVIGSFLIAIILGTGYGFGLVLHAILAGIAGWMLAMRCTENDDELFGIVGFFYTPQRREKLAEVAGHLAGTAKAEAQKVVEAAKRLPERVTGTGADRAAAPTPSAGTPGGADDVSPAPDAPSALADAPADAPGTTADARPTPEEPQEPLRPPEGAATAVGRKPPLLDAPRGDPDDLTRISGIGAKLAAMLNEVGVWHFAQIATWTEDELAWVDSHLGAIRGRARRDDWVGQARALAAGHGPDAAPSGSDPESGPADRP